MKEGFRQCAAWLHTWTGLVVGWVLFFVFVTGTPGYFQFEITRWMQPERPLVNPVPVTDLDGTLQKALVRLEEVAPAAGAANWRIDLPHHSLTPRGWQDLTIRWEDLPRPGHQFGARGTERLDATTGQVLPAGPEPRQTAGGMGLYRMHYVLHYMSRDVGVKIVGVCTMLMLLAIVTGVITHKKIFKDFFTFRPGKGQRSWLDAHNVISVMALPFFVMITYSGLVFFLYQYMPAGRDVVYGSGPTVPRAYLDDLLARGEHKHAAISRPTAPLAPMLARAEADWGKDQIRSIVIERHEGEPLEVVVSRLNGGSLDFFFPPTLRFDGTSGALLEPEPRPGGGAAQTQSVLFNLHEGLFVGTWGRWLYFLAGLLGCGMIGTGLVLWTVKRRKHHLGSGREATEQFGVRLVEHLNVATIAGLPLAVAAYFWSNRLLPVDLGDRAAWEFHSLFVVWLGTLFYALLRPLHRAWIELLWATCAAFALIPLLNALTTDKHLVASLAHGDWVLAGFDLTMAALAAMFAIMAVKVQRRLAPAGSRAKAGSQPALEQGVA